MPLLVSGVLFIKKTTSDHPKLTIVQRKNQGMYWIIQVSI